MGSWGWHKDGDTGMGTQGLSEEGDRDPQGREKGWGPGHGDLRGKGQGWDNLGCTRCVRNSWMMSLSMTSIPYQNTALHGQDHNTLSKPHTVLETTFEPCKLQLQLQ